jgi:hypothetical protein
VTEKMRLESIIKRNRRLIGLITLILLASLMFAPTSPIQLSSLWNPGFEGAKCIFYGVDFRFAEDWEGTYQLHRYQDAEPVLATHQYLGFWDKIYWGSTATPNDAVIEWASGDTHLITEQKQVKRQYPSLEIHVENNIQLEDITRQGDPLGWNPDDPTSGRRIEYMHKKVVKEDVGDKILYHYNVTKETFFIAPAEFWIGLALVPSQTNAGTGSGWREGEWQNVVLWFRLDWTTWDNAYLDSWLNDPEINVFNNPHEGKVLNKQKSYEYRGGFPITGWIQGWEKAGWTSSGEYQESPLWYETRGREEKTYTDTELAILKDKLMSKTRFAPGLVGQFLSLYTEPSASFEYEVPIYSGDTFPEDTITKYVKSPHSSMKSVMYFPINILNFGTYADGDWWNRWTVYYPTAYFRIRVLYGVYGNFTYLWTEELAKDPNIDYPDEPERHQTIVIDVPGVGVWFSGAVEWLSNPFNQMWILFFTLVVVVIVVSVFSPGVWTAMFKTFGKYGR